MRRSVTTIGVAGSCLALAAGSAAASGALWDNGDWDPNIAEANGYSHITTSGLDRRVLSDFTLTSSAHPWGFQMDGVWTTGNIGLGSGIRLWLREDNGGSPGDVIQELATNNYQESTTGGTAFSRPIVRTSVDLVGPLPAGTYWLEMQIQGPENFFQLTSYGADNLIGAETWVNYPDFGGLQPASNIFGVQAEVNWKFIIPSPGALALFGLATIGRRGRRRE